MLYQIAGMRFAFPPYAVSRATKVRRMASRSWLFDVFVDAVQSQIHVEAVEPHRAFVCGFMHPTGSGVAIDVDLPMILRYELASNGSRPCPIR
jgi:hypothetical protein